MDTTSFLQSKEWGEFQTAVGHPAVRFGAIQGFIHRLAPGMRYVYVPRYAINDKRYLDEAANHFAKRGFVFARLEPTSQLLTTHYSLLTTQNRQPRHTLLIDLSKSEEELLAAMHPKTRYNVHLAERRGVTVREEKDMSIFWRLHEETMRRDKFRGHPKSYYDAMLRMSIARQLTAYIGETPIASHILIVFGDTCTYLHGASSDDHRNLMAPYLLQWQGMLLGKSAGCWWYDLWGVAGQASQQRTCFHGYCWDPTHPWSGITRFKAGFGGTPVSYPEAVDILLSPIAYRFYAIARRLRGMI